MIKIKKMRFTGDEIGQLKRELDGYIWVAMDARRGMMAAGDAYIADLRDQLLLQRSQLEDIFAFGLDLNNGKIDYLSAVNRRNPTAGPGGSVPDERRERIEGLTCYFFGEIEPFLVRSTRRSTASAER